MPGFKNPLHYFTKLEITLWCSSVFVIVASFFLFRQENVLTLISSLVGITSLIFCAKGNPIGQLLMIVFSFFYGGISFALQYYGEMITYLGMTLPMSLYAFISWMKNPYGNDHSQVKISPIRKKDVIVISASTILVTIAFYFILRYFHTANLLPSTFSVSTSFLAVYLSAKRSPYFALAYALNDVVLIVLWVLACFGNTQYISVVVCFLAFLINDLYSFTNWKRMERSQKSTTP